MANNLSFDYSPDPHRMVMLVLQRDEFRTIDFFRISGIDEFQSGFFRFSDGKLMPLSDCSMPKIEGPTKFFVSDLGDTIQVRAGGFTCLLESAEIEEPVTLIIHDGTPPPFYLKSGISNFRIDGIDVKARRSLDTTELDRSLLEFILSREWVWVWALKTALAFFILVWLVQFAVYPRRGLGEHFRYSFLLTTISLIAVLMSFFTAYQMGWLERSTPHSGKWYTNLGEMYAPFRDYLAGNTVPPSSFPEEIVNEPMHYALKKTTPYRIVVLGGSTTQGQPPYYPGHASTYVEQLQLLYDAETKGDKRCVEVLNLGGSGNSFRYHIARVFKKLVVPLFNADVVVFNAIHNEYYAEIEPIRGGRFIFMGLLGPSTKEHPVQTESCSNRLRELIRIAELNDISLVFVEEPLNRDYFSGNNPTLEYQMAQRKVCEAADVAYVYAQDAFDPIRDHFLFYDFIHLTYYGNRLLAEMIHEAIEKRNYLDLAECR